MRVLFLSILVSIFFGSYVQAQRIELGKEVLEYLADDKLEGRSPGTEGDKLARKFMAKKFYDMWGGRFSFGYEQPFSLEIARSINSNTALTVGDHVATLNTDFLPVVMSAEVKVEANLYYAGNGLSDETEAAKNKWVLVYLTESGNKMSVFREIIDMSISARDAGAAGVLFASKNDLSSVSEFLSFAYNRSIISLDIPIIQISREFLLEVVSGKRLSLRKLRKNSLEIINKKLGDVPVSGTIQFDRDIRQTANVAAYVEGNQSNEWVVVGAHYDHLGFGGKYSGSRTPDQKAVHNGADDNASGVAMVMMLAEYYKKHAPASNMAFVLFSAEERGLLGSKHFVQNLPFPKEKIKAMVNFDMVGRLVDSSMSISGVATAQEFESLLENWNSKPIHLALGGGGYSGSDQASFCAEKIPVLFFNTGLHDDYHTPDDDAEKINYQGMELIANLSVNLLDSLTNPKFQLNFNENTSGEQSARRGGGMKVKMGLMPDVAGVVKNGLGVDGVTGGGPAHKAGIQKDDVIVAVDNKKVANIYDYMKRLGEYNPGDKVTVDVRRAGEIIQVEVQF
ncbi:MAG: M28 family peptidase [Salinivirgaceae bacterium]|nr:M28 family peptidase [Salinivirgaceae bacterium]